MTVHLLVWSIVVALLFALTVAGVRRYARFAAEARIIDVPNERSSHTTAIPRGGGVAIVAVTLLTTMTGILTASVPPRLLSYVTAAAAIAIVSWIDDVHGVASRTRFAVHVAGAVAAVATFGPWRIASCVSTSSAAWIIDALITILWIAGLTNAWNFMDGIDGIAAATSVVSALAYIAISRYTPAALFIMVPLAASSAGFLTQNWPPAKIFMGDVGSAFTGYSVAVLPLIATDRSPRLFACSLLVVWPFVFDTLLTLFRRLLRHENIFAAHRSHLYQRLVIAGKTHRFTTSLYVALAVVCSLEAIILRVSAGRADAAVIAVAFITAAFLATFTGATERKHQKLTRGTLSD